MSGGYYSPNAGETITAANWRTYVRDQTVNHFASSSARSSAISSPVQGLVSYRDDLGGGNIETYSGTAWVPAGMQLIASNTLGSAVSTVTFSSIPSVYSSLMLNILGSVSGATADADCKINFNSDTGANYTAGGFWWATGDPPTGVHEGFTNAQTSVTAAFQLPGTTYNGNRAAVASIVIPGYSNTTFRKGLVGNNFGTDGGTSWQARQNYGWWSSTSAISTILLTSGSGNFSTGSMFSLYGMP